MSLSYADVRKKVVVSESRFNRLNLLIAERGFSHSRVWRAVMNREFDSPERLGDSAWIEEMDLHVQAAVTMGYKKPF
jgi:predicted DNA-binding transcriptional regulator AlpA